MQEEDTIVSYPQRYLVGLRKRSHCLEKHHHATQSYVLCFVARVLVIEDLCRITLQTQERCTVKVKLIAVILRVVSVSVIEKEKELLAPLLFAAVFFAGVFFPLLEDLAVLAMIFCCCFADMKALVLLFVFCGTRDWYGSKRTGFLLETGKN